MDWPAMRRAADREPQGRMTVQSNSNVLTPPVDEPRLLRAQLELVVRLLPMTLWINPTWAVLSIVPFLGLFHMFGDLAAWRIATMLALHLMAGVIAVILYRQHRANPGDTKSWLARLLVFQALTWAVWGAMVWLLWQDGNPANNIFVFVSIVGALWSYASSRAMHMGIYLAGIVPIVAIAFLRFITGQGQAAEALALMLALIFLYTTVLAFGARRQIEVMLNTRFANDDMTVDLHRAHDEALRKRYEAEAANASKTTFLANMSHELRTPLNAILGFSDIIANERLGGVGTPRYKDYANDINASGTHLLNIINDILDIAKIESGKMEISPQILDPREAIESAVLVVAGRARERRQTITIDVDSDAPMPYADDRALKQIIINLMSNAIKFTQEGGAIHISGRGADGGFQLCVADNGPGIPLELQDRIFTPFNQVDNRYNRSAGGTGLGLSLVRGLAELHGGKAWIDSAPGEGTRAFVNFPVANAPQVRVRDRARA